MSLAHWQRFVQMKRASFTGAFLIHWKQSHKYPNWGGELNFPSKSAA